MTHRHTFSGDYAYGVIENIEDDPKKINRVQVRLNGLHNPDKGVLPTENLPWCQVLLPCTEADSSSHGLRVGMTVKCSFLDGIERQIPIVEGVLPGEMDSGSSITGNSDKTISKYADGRGVAKKEKLDGTQPEDPFAAKYPYNRVIETSSGHRIEIDDTPGKERVHFYHKSGTNTEYHPDGSLVTAVTKDEFVVVNGKSTHVIKGDQVITVKGKETIKVTGDCSVETDGKLTAKAGGDVLVDAGGKADVKAGGDATVNAGGNITMQGGGNITIVAGGVLTLNGAQIMIG